MNKLESYITTSPSGKAEECGKYTIDTTSSPFVLNDITEVGQKYTLSLWIKADAAGSLTVCGTTYAVNTEWEKHKLSYTADSVNLSLWFTVAGTYYIYHPQLEVGDVSTDWTPAPEDQDTSVDEKIESLAQSTSEQITQCLQDSQSIILSALDSYVERGAFEEYKKFVETQFVVMNNQVQINLTTTIERIETVNGNLQSQLDEYGKTFHFTDDGLLIGELSNPVLLRLDNDIIQFLRDNMPQLYIAEHGVYADEIHAKRIMFDTWQLVEENGKFSVKKV